MKDSIVIPFTQASPAVEVTEPGPRDELAIRFQLTSGTLSALVMAIAASALSGWAFDIPALKSVFPGFVTMKVNSAIGLALTGAALWRYRGQDSSTRRDTWLTSCAGIALFIGAVTVLEYATGWNLGIDELLVRDTGSGAMSPGRMALATAVSLVLLNGALLVARAPKRYGLAQLMVAGATVMAAATTMMRARADG